jgi:hypothetical protein
MAYAPEPIRFVGQQASEGRYLAEPYIIVGKIPAGAITAGTAPAAAPVPFADLTAAANAYNALRTALINAGILA